MKICYLFNLLIAITNTVFLKKYLHIYQLKNYNNRRYFKYFKNKKSLFLLLCLFLFLFEIFFQNIMFCIVTNSILYLLNFIFVKNLIKSQKTPLVLTGKLSRLYIISIFILLSLCFYKFGFALIIVATFLSPTIANMLNIYDKIKNKKFINQAKEKLKNSFTQIIAITGSNGKTSVKNILLQILSTEHTTQATPASFNTPLGIAKFINEELKKDTEFLILEYGARHKNDIKKLCKLFGADYGIITTISPQHLETFKSTKNIVYAKSQLAKFLDNKPCVFNIDNLHTRQMHKEKSFNSFSASISEKADIYAKNLKIVDNLMHFDLIFNKKTHNLKINLLGRHNVLNICMATAIANLVEIKEENIIKAINNLKPINHRLELIKTHINILDDSYNCSPASAKESLWVLKNFSGKKMIATPGIIECGKEKYNINFNLGKQMSFCNYCIIVGRENQQALLNGINASKSQNNKSNLKVFMAKNLEDAKQYFSNLQANDTLLLLNDLPDDYKWKKNLKQFFKSFLSFQYNLFHLHNSSFERAFQWSLIFYIANML